MMLVQKPSCAVVIKSSVVVLLTVGSLQGNSAGVSECDVGGQEPRVVFLATATWLLLTVSSFGDNEPQKVGVFTRSQYASTESPETSHSLIQQTFTDVLMGQRCSSGRDTNVDSTWKSSFG